MTPAAADRPPEVVITTSCAVDEGSFADVDGDGTDDLVLRSGPHVFSWPSTRGSTAPVVWTSTHPGEAGPVDVSTPNVGPPRVQWWGFYPDGSYEFEVDRDTLQLVQVGSGPDWVGAHHIGDIDGDGIADLYELSPYSVRASSTGLYTPIPGWGEVPGSPYFEYNPYYVWSVGDLNHDGYDDLLVGQRQESGTLDGSYEERAWGPAQLYLGSPTGITTEPLWTLFAPGLPRAGVGRGVAALPDERALVVTVVEEGVWSSDFSPEWLGVIRDADTPHAAFDPLVEVPEIGPGGRTPYLMGWMADEGGQASLAMVEAWGVTGIRWFPWSADGTGFQAIDGVAVPGRAWVPAAEHGSLDPYSDDLAYPVGRHQQAILLALVHDEHGRRLVVWGRTRDQLGIPSDGVTTEGCTFAAYDALDAVPAPVDTGEGYPSGGFQTTFGPDPAGQPSSRGCGCDTAAGGLWPAGLVAVAARVASARRPRRRR